MYMHLLTMSVFYRERVDAEEGSQQPMRVHRYGGHFNDRPKVNKGKKEQRDFHPSLDDRRRE